LFACIATLFTLPVALLAGRYLRAGDKWFKVHVIFNTITVLLIVLVFGLGMGAVHAAHLGRQFAGPYSDLHHKVGATVLSITLMQAIIGVLAHYSPGGSFFRRLHVPFGIIVAAGMYWNTWEGKHNEWAAMSTSMTVTPQAVQIIFWVLFLVSATAYAGAVGTTVLDGLKIASSVPQTVEVASDENLREKP
jgi:hypothetical protein